MIMKIIAILSLILVFWCNQSHHHIFMLINSSPLSLASEEFIPVSDGVPSSENIPTTSESPIAGQSRSQSDKKSDSIHEENVDSSNEKGRTAQTNHVEFRDDPKEQINVLHDPNSVPPITTEAQEKSQSDNSADRTDRQRNADPKNSNLDTSKDLEGTSVSNLENGAPEVSNDLKTNANEEEIKAFNFSTSAKQLESNQSLDYENDNVSSTSAGDFPTITTENGIPEPIPQKEEEPIPSFMEWTQIQQKKLQELGAGATGSGGQPASQNGNKNSYATNSQQNKSSLTGTQASAAKVRKEDNAKNFASPDCGAKVIQSNPESQNANGVLSSSHDEYMLNKCGVPIWFVVELCEPLKIEKVSLGNLELFSSSPKDFEIGISDRYPTRDWNKLGPFTLPDIRAIHSINLPATNASTFGKFLKVNIISHHGTEHFCPLSLVRVNGISEYEVLESENTHQEDIDAAGKQNSALYEELVDEQSTEGNVADKSVFGSAKDVVINIVKKAAQVLVKSDSTKESPQQTTDVVVQSKCRSILQCLPNYEMPFRDRVMSLLSCNFSNLLPFLSHNSPWCGWDYCHALFSKQSIGLPWQPEGFYASVFGGPSVLHALCNYHRPLTKETCDALFISNGSSTPTKTILAEGYINESLKSPAVNIGTIPGETEDMEEKKRTLQELNQNVSKQEIKDAVSNESASKGQPQEVDQTFQQSGEPSHVTPGEIQQTTTSTIPAPNTPVAGSSEDPYIPPQNGNQQQQPSSVQQQQQKESVFVRLSNRIKTLERNQSMTASYLEELSRRFKKQNEENYHINEGTKKFTNESRVKFKTLEDLYKFELRSLRRNTDEVRERLFNVQLQRSLLILLCLVQFACLASAVVWVRKRFRHFETQLETVTQQQPPPVGLLPVTPVVPRHESSHILSIRKRVNSEHNIVSGLNSIDKSKKIKKKKKKLADLKPVSVKLTGPASAPLEYTNGKENEFKFDYPTPVSSASVFDIPASSFKENIYPEPPKSSMSTSRSALTALSSTAPSSLNGATLFSSTKVDSPFSMISSTTPNFFGDTGVSTSSRFAILASPGPSTVSKPMILKRSGSLTSLDSSSTSSYSYGGKMGGLHNVINGHGDSQSSNGKKRKNKGLKALMPKIFDR